MSMPAAADHQLDERHLDVESKHYPVATTASTPQSLFAAPTIANPGPLGLSAFALTTFVLSLHNAGAGVPAAGPSNVVVGLAFFYGGVVQLCAGMWEFLTGNTFGATAFSSYGGFWLSYALIFIPGADILGAYGKVDVMVLERSLGIYLISWAIFTALLLIASHRSSVGLVSLFFCLFITFVLLAAAKFNNSVTTQVAGGAFGVITAIIAWYNALSGLLTKDSSYFLLPVGRLS
ncbi:GPR1/FUN34/yaaH family-domain-containing protein [Radiomyces spectabilis]|uniref:GPR1/FUN34/yaaH family-domain-containing protein n=1 Tax=Radiomyces spectabilis TaxID=64574 RepID=UPI00221F1D8F|nr:GPR1/FUN34/yaaH family-domain-containing protein [Radiomyces spectabilis]KAI8374125.1 GPR1/FUN34/yaaH family-domain-containing protein [Radiomyces spectabilis]